MASNSKCTCEMYLSSTLNTSELKHSCAPSTLTPHWKCEKASRCQYWLTRLIHWGREREVVWPLSSLNAVVSYVFLHVAHIDFLTSLTSFFWELYLQPRCSCLNLLTSPGQALNATSSMAQAANSSTNFANSCQVRDSTWRVFMDTFLGRKNHWSDNEVTARESSKKEKIHGSARCQWCKYLDLIWVPTWISMPKPSKNGESKLAKTSF